ncbi:hypothetical protein, partial [Serratia nevei]|uniref:hypothetical protein n=1 Tax=Serratia nevei TaxID=2703794 RepID=UPI002AA2B1E6
DNILHFLMQIIINKGVRQAAIAARKPYTFAGKTGAVITSNHYNTKNNIDKLFTPNDTPVSSR